MVIELLVTGCHKIAQQGAASTCKEVFCAHLFLSLTTCLSTPSRIWNSSLGYKGRCQKVLSGFFSIKGKPFCQKTLSGKLPKNFLKKWVKRGQNRRFLAKNSVFFADFFLNGIGGYPPPLTENHCAQKPLTERGVPPPPLP